MSRKPRFTLPDVPQHVIKRGNNREACFYAEEDYWRYLHDLKEAAPHNQAAIHAYILFHMQMDHGQIHAIREALNQ